MRMFHCAFILFYFSFAYVQAQESRGIIAGGVLDEHGQPVVGAQVCVGRIVVNDKHSQTLHSNCFAKTDDSGQFRVENISMGNVVVEASKPKEGYCGLGSGGANPKVTTQTTTVTLSPASPVANVVLKLGPKDGMVAPIVADLLTGQPIYNFMAEARVYDTEHPNENHAAITGGFSRWTTSLCVPANTDLSLRVWAKGYKAVVYPSPTQPSVPTTMRLTPGETVSFQVGLSLEDKADPNAH
jgi:hypothetical protein